MRKSQRLASLIKIVQQREKKLAGCVSKSRSRCSAHEVQLAQLNTYRTQYRAALLPDQGGLSVRQLKDAWQFIWKLDEAIAQATRRVAQSREEYWRDHQSFMAARVRAKVLEGLRSCYQLQEQRAELRREHKEHDEYAQRMVTHGRHN